MLGHEIGHVIARHSSERIAKFFSTHPAPENRSARIEESIRKQFPGGVPEGLKR